MSPPPTARELLDGIGIDALCERIEAGESIREIAEAEAISEGAIRFWLKQPTDDDITRSARATASRTISAESWRERGRRYLIEAKSVPWEITRAHHLEQHCAREAACRDPARYGDKQHLEHTGKDGTPLIPSQTLTDEQLKQEAIARGLPATIFDK